MKISNHPLICIEPLRASSICVKHPIVPKMALQICNRLWIGNSRDSFSHVISLEIHATVFTVNKNQSKVERFLVSLNQIRKLVNCFYLLSQQGGSPGVPRQREQNHLQGYSPGDFKWGKRSGKRRFNQLVFAFATMGYC